MLTQEELKRHVTYNPDTGDFIRIYHPTQTGLIGKVCSSLDRKGGYIRIAINTVRYKAQRLAFLYMTGSWPKGEVDHINRIKADNRWVNLRDVSKSQNLRNQHRSYKPGHGVYRTSDGHGNITYAVKFRINGIQEYFGCRPTREEAIALAQEVKQRRNLFPLEDHS